MVVRTDPRVALGFLKSSELTQLCKEQGLKNNGRKAELIERLVLHREEREKAGAFQAARGVENKAAQWRQASARGTERVSSTPQRSVGASTPPSSARTRSVAAIGNGAAAAGRSPASSVGRGRGVKGRGRGRGKATVSDAIKTAAVASESLLCTHCNTLFQLHNREFNHKREEFWCPLCRLKFMDPFNKVVEPKGTLRYALVTSSSLDFKLELSELKQWRKNGFSVEVRMVKVDCDKLHQAWPHSLKFFVNGSEAFAVQPPEEGHKRRDVPIPVSAALKHGTNSIGFVIEDSLVSNFALAVMQTKPVSSLELASKVTRCDQISAKSRVCAVLGKHQDGHKGAGDEITCLSSDKLCLRCPITMDRIKDPVRGIQCQHLQCFSLDAYLQSNRQMRAFNNRWRCPVCTLILRPDDLTLDPYVDEVLASTAADVDEVVVGADGSWKCISQDSREDSASSASQPARRPEAVDLDALSPVRPLGSSGAAATPLTAPATGRQRESLSTPLSPPQKRLRASPSSESTVDPSVARAERSLQVASSCESAGGNQKGTTPQSLFMGALVGPIDIDVVSDPE